MSQFFQLSALAAALGCVPSALLALKAHIASERFRRALDAAAREERASIEKTGFRPNQPRIPQGQPGAGQWTDGTDVGIIPAGKKLGGARQKKPGLSGKEAARDVPYWAKGEAPLVGEVGKAFATRLLDKKYGRGKYETGTNSEYNRLKKFGDRAFE